MIDFTKIPNKRWTDIANKIIQKTGNVEQAENTAKITSKPKKKENNG